jgi:hypothetical protein
MKALFSFFIIPYLANLVLGNIKKKLKRSYESTVMGPGRAGHDPQTDPAPPAPNGSTVTP